MCEYIHSFNFAMKKSYRNQSINPSIHVVKEIKNWTIYYFLKLCEYFVCDSRRFLSFSLWTAFNSYFQQHVTHRSIHNLCCFKIHLHWMSFSSVIKSEYYRLSFYSPPIKISKSKKQNEKAKKQKKKIEEEFLRIKEISTSVPLSCWL